jgi:hypothetical protein
MGVFVVTSLVIAFVRWTSGFEAAVFFGLAMIYADQIANLEAKN